MSEKAIRLSVHGSGEGPDAMTGKQTDGISVSFDDGTVTNAFLSWKSFKQLLLMKTRQNQPAPKPQPVNGPPVAAAVK